jgi:hypothetical protein
LNRAEAKGSKGYGQGYHGIIIILIVESRIDAAFEPIRAYRSTRAMRILLSQSSRHFSQIFLRPNIAKRSSRHFHNNLPAFDQTDDIRHHSNPKPPAAAAILVDIYLTITHHYQHPITINTFHQIDR